MEQRTFALPLILGTLTTAAVIAGIVVVVALTGFLLQSFSVLFVIPIGAGLAGAGCGAGVFLALLWLNKRPAGLHYWLATILGLAGFIGTYLALYLTTYVTKDLTLNHSFTGVPISAVLSFFDYLRMDVGNRESTFFINVGHAHVPIGMEHGIQLGPVINWVGFAFESVGYVVGGLLAGYFILGDRKYCDTCKVYMKSKDDLFRTLIGDLDKKVEAINAVLSTGSGLRALVEKEKSTAPKDVRGEPHMRFAIEYCPRCFSGYLYAKLMRKTRDGFEELPDHRQTIRLENSTVHDFLL